MSKRNIMADITHPARSVNINKLLFCEESASVPLDTRVHIKTNFQSKQTKEDDLKTIIAEALRTSPNFIILYD